MNEIKSFMKPWGWILVILIITIFCLFQYVYFTNLGRTGTLEDAFEPALVVDITNTAEASKPTEIPYSERIKIEYSKKVIPDLDIIFSSRLRLKILINRPDTFDDNWFSEVTDHIDQLKYSSKSAIEVPVPTNCNDCKKYHAMFETINSEVGHISIYWNKWKVNKKDSFVEKNDPDFEIIKDHLLNIDIALRPD